MAYYRGAQSPRDEQQYTNPLSPPSQRNPNRWSANMATTGDVRGSLTRRFTTNTVPTLSPIGQQRRQAAGDMQATNAQSRMTPSERAARHYETLLQAQRKIQEELEKVDAETRREVDENIRHEQSVTQLFAQSEPTTPPEYQNAFSNNFSRPNRYSTASLISPPGLVTRPNRSSTQLTSPAAGFARPYTANNNPNLPSQSVPGSRRQSDGEEDDDDFVYGFENTIRRAGANPNRNSMPITSYDRSKRNTTDLVFGPVNTTGFLFNDDDKLTSLPKSNQTSPPDSKTYLQVQHTADGFPKLIRREENGDLQFSPVSAALDLASSTTEAELTHVAERAAASRHRISLPPSALSGGPNIAPLNSILANANDSRPSSNRRSMEVKFSAETKRPALLATPPRGLATNGSLKAQSSYSTNDIPTLKSINGDAQEGGVSILSPSNHQAALANATTSPDQNRAAALQSLLAATNRQSRDFANATNQDSKHVDFDNSQPSLHAAAPPFNAAPEPVSTQSYTSPNMAPYAAQPAAYYGGYGMHMMSNGFSNMSLNGNGFAPQGNWGNQFNSPYPQQGGYGGFQQFPPNGQAGPGAGRFEGANNHNASRSTQQQRKQAAEDAQAKYNSIKVEHLTGEIYNLCKDQHGCRFLQRKLEERNEQTVQVIFDEVKEHMIELMVDPFGNYLCQKLLESVNDDQRTILIENASPAMTKIALNQHGTRALQKMIEYISTPEQIELIIKALGNDVVLLIQDLNGNHVIQKCLNHLSSIDASFIFEAVGANCITVGTHRHGCCVLQRCIDHADGLQKGQMVDHVIRNAHALVQDPFGNYVVQYILDLSEPCFTEPLCRAFYGEIPALSRQKFSSNVIEKCIRCSSEETRRELIREIMVPQVLEKLLRDGFANYVVQTAMDFSDEELKPAMYENIRQIIPGIRNTPHGRRIASKLTDYDNRMVNPTTSILSPLETATVSAGGPAFNNTQRTPTRANRHGMIGAPTQWGNNGAAFGAAGFDGGNFGANGYGGDGIASPTPQRNQNSFMFNNAPTFANGFGGPGFVAPGPQQPYGHF
ncbi:Putative armadillo-like helical, pumilio domain-containing protein [Septoria linicola]|uniref:Armadillo-like helical, pumilio domain-containing protein n=1 Tax=Septoria linicola TaxID=215465 RepID=A0A9Q9AHU7_9PEZI|nr:Putative armadillo-like helical, pumilio domain-containing protein [Septoria linicola]